MVTNNPNPSTPPSSSKPDNSKQRLIAIAAVVIVALLAINAVLLVSYTKRGKSNAELTSNLDESQQLKAELEKQYYEALSEMESMRGSNEEMNALIEQQKQDLTEQKGRIEELLTDRKNLGRARSEIKKLNQQVEQYLAELNQLREQNAALTSENSQLSEERNMLNADLQSERMNTAMLSSERALLVSEKEDLSNTNQALSRKVTLASAIKVNGIEVDGQKIRKSGKAVTRRDAENVDQVNICFNTAANDIAEPGTEEFMIRIINPTGETLAIENLGSGTFTSNSTGEQVRYTTSKTMNYNGSAGQLCLLWAPGQSFPAGNYDLEIYNKGFLTGSTSFQLK
jgi:myosin heavy subunit